MEFFSSREEELKARIRQGTAWRQEQAAARQINHSVALPNQLNSNETNHSDRLPFRHGPSTTQRPQPTLFPSYHPRAAAPPTPAPTPPAFSFTPKLPHSHPNPPTPHAAIPTPAPTPAPAAAAPPPPAPQPFPRNPQDFHTSWYHLPPEFRNFVSGEQWSLKSRYLSAKHDRERTEKSHVYLKHYLAAREADEPCIEDFWAVCRGYDRLLGLFDDMREKMKQNMRMFARAKEEIEGVEFVEFDKAWEEMMMIGVGVGIDVEEACKL